MPRKPIIAVIGGGSSASREGVALAEEVGFLIARADAVLICGGLNGVMEASAKGAKRGGGATIGVLPTGKDRKSTRLNSSHIQKSRMPSSA